MCAATLRTQPFGSRRAPANWARAAQFPEWCLEQLCGIVLAVYVDDCCATEPKTTAGPALSAILAMCQIFGLFAEQSKTATPTTQLKLLGASISIFDTHIATALAADKRDALVLDIRNFLRTNRLTPAQAAKIRGRLGFAQSLMFGRMGRALAGPLSDRQYSKGGRTTSRWATRFDPA